MCGRELVNEECCCKETATCKGCNMPGRELINKEHCSKEKTACEDGNMRGGGLVNEKGCSKEKTACKGGKTQNACQNALPILQERLQHRRREWRVHPHPCQGEQLHHQQQ